MNLYETFANKWLRPNGTIWIFSDPHFKDDESLNFRGKSYPGDDAVVKRINSKVGKNDTIIFLGDIGNVEFIKRIRGYKVLLLGNHDKGASNYKKEIYHDTRFIDEFPTDFIPEEHGYKVVDPTPLGNLYDKVTTNGLFDEVYEGPLMINDRLILSHEPIIPLAHCLFNIHGHDHSCSYIDDNHMNVCAEAINYTPVNLLKLLKEGLLKNVESIHRTTIDKATEKKQRKGTQQ